MSKKWLQMAEMYKRFAKDFEFADFSDYAAEEMYLFESTGKPIYNENNGFLLGKKYMDVTIAMWKEDILKGQLFVFELLKDDYPEWFLERMGVLKLRASREFYDWLFYRCKNK